VILIASFSQHKNQTAGLSGNERQRDLQGRARIESGAEFIGQALQTHCRRLLQRAVAADAELAKTLGG